MAEARKKSSIFQFALIFLVVYLLTQMAVRTFFPEPTNGVNGEGSIVLKLIDATVKGGHHPEISIRNTTEEDLVLQDRCPMPPVDVWKIEGEERIPLTAEETALPCVAVLSVPAGETVKIDLGPWKYSLFSEFTNYEIQLPVAGEEITAQFSIYEAGTITQLFRTFITKPFLNFLILVASILPNHSLGIAIIVLTLLVKLVLFFPTQHALEGQKKLQAIQPKIDEIRKKFKSDPQRMNQETMKLWKQEKINPMQSCLPMLLQFPFLIGLFFVIRDGAVLELSQHLIYAPYMHLDWVFNTQFLGFDLTQPSIYVFPPMLVIMQFVQMKLSFAIAKKKKDKKPSSAKATEGKKEPASAQDMQQKVMLYGLPLMIGFFAIKFPAAVSLYWGISTLFAIGQQLVVNREHLK